MNLFRPNIQKMTGYTPGKQPKGGGFVKLNTNENPYPPSPKVIAAIKHAACETLRLYPDPLATAAREKAAAVLGVKPAQVLMGNGSDDLLTMIIRAFVGPGDKVAFPYPTYSLYDVLVKIQDGISCPVDFPDDYSLPNNIVVKGAKVTFIANPNAPSGTMIHASELSDLAERVSGALVIDEAYVDFADFNCLHLVNRHPNVILLRTLSKSYSLAGIRSGFAVSTEEIIAGLMKVKDSYNVDRLGMVATLAALDDVKRMRRNAEKIKASRSCLTEALVNLGFAVYPSESNFVLAKCPRWLDAEATYEDLERRRILVRYFKQRMVDDCLRITVGTPREINALLKALAEITGPFAPKPSRK
ncbi:MAG: histidinol-phosphate transaminase [Planctomycetes bacterium]|nr:histidinol-phosphate transaminase [Planctomycetota bacterium]